MPAQIIPVIMCGGAGTRLWPVSRESMPKQFVPLVGRGSTFQQVLERIADPALFARAIVITNAEFRFVVAEQLREVAVNLNVGHLMLLLQFGNMSKELTRYNTQLFAERVLPQMKDLFSEWEDRWWPQPMTAAERAEIPAFGIAAE